MPVGLDLVLNAFRTDVLPKCSQKIIKNLSPDLTKYNGVSRVPVLFGVRPGTVALLVTLDAGECFKLPEEPPAVVKLLRAFIDQEKKVKLVSKSGGNMNFSLKGITQKIEQIFAKFQIDSLISGRVEDSQFAMKFGFWKGFTKCCCICGGLLCVGNYKADTVVSHKHVLHLINIDGKLYDVKVEF